MNWFPTGPIIHFAAFAAYAVLIVIIFVRNPNGKSNKLAAALFSCLAVWSFCKIFLQNPLTPENIAYIFVNIAIVSGTLFPVLVFWFLVSLTDKKNLYHSRILIFMSFAFPAFFIAINRFGLLMLPLEHHAFGWVRKWIQGGIFSYLYYLYYLGAAVCGLIYYSVSLDKNTQGLKRKQSTVLFVSSGITLAAGIFFEVIVPVFNINTGMFEDIANLYILIWAMGIFIIIFRYKSLALTPATASESIIAAMNEALVLLDDDANISFVNQPVLELLQYGENELKGQPFHKIIYDRTSVNVFLKEVIKNRRFKSQEFLLKRGDGTPLPCIFSASLIMEIGEIRGIVCVANDITALKNAEAGLREERDKAQSYMKELKESYDKLKQLDVLKSNFTSMVSHELRTPITSIKGFVSFLMGGAAGPLSAQQKEFVSIIKNNSDRLLTLINDLLDTSKMESGSFSIIKAKSELSIIIDECFRDVNSLSKNKKITLTKESSGQKFITSVDAYRFSQAIVNLINNSIKFSPPNSTITVRLDRKNSADIKIPAYADISKLVPGNCIRISVEDQGAGIDPDKLTRIFDKYYQVEDINTRKAQGTGLGLNIVKNIIELHGGAVWAESKGAGLGAAFIILIPEN